MDKRKNVIVKIRLEDDVCLTDAILNNDDLLKSQTISDNSVHTIDGILKKKDLYSYKNRRLYGKFGKLND